MEKIIREATRKTPSVLMDATTGIIEFKGRSIPENSVEFYTDLIVWIDGYGKKLRATTIVNIQLEYFNTSSSKCLLDIFKKLELISKWAMSSMLIGTTKSDGDDIHESGEDYQTMVNLKTLNFKLIEMCSTYSYSIICL